MSFWLRPAALCIPPMKLADVVVGVSGDQPVYLRDVGTIEDGAEEPADYVLYGTGPAHQKGNRRNSPSTANSLPAVTISVAKRKGTNAIVIADQVIEKVEKLKGSLIPGDVTSPSRAITVRRPARNRTNFCCT